MEALTGLLPEHWIACLTLAVTICGLITTVLPAPSADSGLVYRTIYMIIQWIALNLGKAKNAQDQKTLTFQTRPTYPASAGGASASVSEPSARIKDGKH